MSPSASAIPGGHPSTTHPIAGPWLSPNEVTQKSLPNVLPDMGQAKQKQRLPRSQGEGFECSTGGRMNSPDAFAPQME